MPTNGEPAKEPRLPRSLYFDYRLYPFERPPELAGRSGRHPVAVVGAGPVGLTVALDLARRGIEVVVLEQERTVSVGSRAICISRRSLEILQPLGVASPLYAKSLPWTSGRSFYRNRLVFALEMPHGEDERYFPMVNIQQSYVERFLVERLARLDGAAIRWGNRVTGIEAGGEDVRLRVATPEGEYTARAEYVVAADGARSTVRELMGLKLSGESYEGSYLIADIKLHSSHPTERRAWFDPPSNRGSTVLMHKQPDDIWRVDFQLTAEESAAGLPSEAHVRARIQQQLDMVGETGDWALDWYSLYHAHCLCLDRYVHGRVAFAGDAAHLVPIFGVRGLNSGFADATNLSWKLARVLQGRSRPELLETYTQERREATLEIFREAGMSTQFMTPQTRGYRLLRDSALSLALTQAFARPLVNPRQTQPYDYSDSPLNAAGDDDSRFTGGPRVGSPACNVRLGKDEYLLDHLGADFTALYFTAAETEAEPLAQWLARCAADGESPRLLVVGRESEDPSWIGLPDRDQRVLDVYAARPDTLYLLRPDGHVCGRWLSGGLDAAPAALRLAVMAKEE